MRTVTRVDVDLSTLRLKKHAEPQDAAREILELLLAEERFIWPEHEPLSQREILDAYDSFVGAHQHLKDLPTDPEGHGITHFVREYLELDPDSSELGLDLDRETQLRFDAMRHAISILAQMPKSERDEIPNVWRVIEDRQTRVFGLMFQTDNRFSFRLRYHTPESLKAATERLVNAIAPRHADAVAPVVEAAPATSIAGVTDELRVTFRRIEMKTPAGEVAQVGDVHVVGSAGGLVAYVGWRTPQRVLLILSALLLVCDLLFQILVPDMTIGNLDATDWGGGTLGRLTTAAFTAYLFAVLLEYLRLRGRFRRRRAAFIDWGTPEGAG